MKVGIDTASFYCPRYYLELADLAAARGVDRDKYQKGLGQHQMAACPPDEDIITMAANAAKQALTCCDPSEIHALLFATESGIDQSKAAGIYVHHLLNLPNHCRIVEVKQACYSGTAALQMAAAMVRQTPHKKVLVIMSDIARYGLNTAGEPSQGGGAVAMIVSSQPRLASLSPHSGYMCEDVMDFWRPNYREEALVDGKYSIEIYLRLLKECWSRYQAESNLDIADHAFYLFHIPIPRLAEKAYQKLMLASGLKKPDDTQIQRALDEALLYSRTVGNCYTASLYLGLISLLDHHPQDLSHQRLGLYSYGSGCVGEFFSVTIEPGYEQVLHRAHHKKLIATRTAIDVATYEHFYQFHFPKDGSSKQLPCHRTGSYRLVEINQHKRVYKSLKNAD